MNVSSPLLPPAVAANVAATNFGSDLTALGATKVVASDAGLALEFATPVAAQVAHAVLRDELQVGTEQIHTTVPVTYTTSPESVAPVALHDASEAIKHLDGVMGTGLFANGSLGVITLGDQRAADLASLLRPAIANTPVFTQAFQAPSGTGWGSGFGRQI